MILTEMWIVATGVLLAGLIDDLRSRKVHNALILFLAPLLLLTSVYFRGFDGTMIGVSAFLAGAILASVLFLIGVFGGGDVKLFMLFAFCVDPAIMFWTLLYSFVWGALFGLTRAALQRELMSLVRSTYRLASSRQRIQTPEVHKVPFTFALVLGWMTQLTIMHVEGLL